MMNWTPKDLRTWEDARAVPSMASQEDIKQALALEPKKRTPRTEMNKTEARYAEYLAVQKALGIIRDWRFQEFTFRLAPDLRYTPDFAVLRNSPAQSWTMIDVKGRKGNSYWAEEDSKVKIKMCPVRFPWFRWCIVYPESNGEWTEVEFNA